MRKLVVTENITLDGVIDMAAGWFDPLSEDVDQSDMAAATAEHREGADALLVAGGDVLYLCHWMRESGLADLLTTLSETVWVGLSAGSMVMTPVVGDDFIQWRPPTADHSTLGVVDFSICPHLAADGMPGNSLAEAEQWAAGIPNAAYAIDDQTAITVVDGVVEVVSEGEWTRLR